MLDALISTECAVILGRYCLALAFMSLSARSAGCRAYGCVCTNKNSLPSTRVGLHPYFSEATEPVELCSLTASASFLAARFRSRSEKYPITRARMTMPPPKPALM